jgi:hypothetical protein
MARRRASVQDKFELFRFTMDDWYREYRFSINLHPWEYSPGHYDEHDAIVVVGALRNRTKRKFNRGELHLLPTDTPRSKWSDEATRIGNIWVMDGCLHASAWMASDTFYSLTPAFATGRFKEMSITVSNLRYNKGGTYGIHLDHELTVLEEDE